MRALPAKLHPLYGFPFEARQLGAGAKLCAMGLEPHAGDVELQTVSGPRSICLAHDLIRCSLGSREAFASEITNTLLTMHPRPWWMPNRMWQHAHLRAEYFGLKLAAITLDNLTIRPEGNHNHGNQ